MSQAGNDSNNLTKFRSNIINVKFPGQMAINQYSKICASKTISKYPGPRGFS